MDARAVWKAGFETRLEDTRGHAVTIDEPVDDGGTDAGTSALELTVMSLAGCMSTIFHIIAEKRRLPFAGFAVSLHADRAENAPTIERVTGTVEVQTDAPIEDVETVLRLTLRTCPVGVLMNRAQIPVDVTPLVVPPPAHHEHKLPYEVPEPEWAL